MKKLVILVYNYFSLLVLMLVAISVFTWGCDKRKSPDRMREDLVHLHALFVQYKHETGSWPNDTNVLLEKFDIKPFLDPWGKPYKIIIEIAGDKHKLILSSSGTDELWGTMDDLLEARELTMWHQR